MLLINIRDLIMTAILLIYLVTAYISFGCICALAFLKYQSQKVPFFSLSHKVILASVAIAFFWPVWMLWEINSESD